MCKKNYHKIETKNDASINVFGYENEQVYRVCWSKIVFESRIQLFLIDNEDSSHYVYFKDFK